MALLKKILVVLFCMGFVSCVVNRNNSSNDPNLDALKTFAEYAKLTYIEASDTLVTARLPKLPDALNQYLYNCINTKQSEADKYAFLLVLRLAEEFYTVNDSDYDFCNYKNNGIIDLVRKRMGIAFDPIGCSFFKTYDVYLWVKANRSKFKDYQPLMNQLKRLEKVLH